MYLKTPLTLAAEMLKKRYQKKNLKNSKIDRQSIQKTQIALEICQNSYIKV